MTARRTEVRAEGDDRLDRVRAILGREGMEAELAVAGAEAEIVVVRAGPDARPTLARLAPEIRAVGFRYVTIELTAGFSMKVGNR